MGRHLVRVGRVVFLTLGLSLLVFAAIGFRSNPSGTTLALIVSGIGFLYAGAQLLVFQALYQKPVSDQENDRTD